PVLAALYPIGMLILQACVAIGLTLLGVMLCAMITPLLGLAALPLFPLILWAFKQLDGHLYAYYLMHDYAYSAQSRGAYAPDLEHRMADFAATIETALNTDVDEVLVIGHSSGAHLAVSILADLLRAGRVPPGASLAFLSLGHVMPMVAFLPNAHRLRRDLAYLGSCPNICWVDVTSIADGCTFALCDPVAVTGVAQDDQKWPLILSAAFQKTLSPAAWKALKWRYFSIHFQYLHAFDRPGDYDYFQITAGPIRLQDRYAHRAPSPNAIRTPVSKYTSVTPWG
ncbi:MAG: hypothetical protein AAF701_07485, partial [Pseudomonadota bacterium]